MDTAGNIRHRNQGGFVLIASMIMLLVLTFMAIALYHNFTVQQNMSSNTKEKGRAFQMAQSTLQYAESQILSNGLGIVPIGGCTAPPSSSSVLTVCNAQSPVNIAAPAEGAPMTMTNGMTFNPSTIDPNSGITISATGGAGTYFKVPNYFVQFLGNGPTSTCPSTPSQLYLTTALAYGGTGGTVAEVQSTYQIQTTVCNTGSP